MIANKRSVLALAIQCALIPGLALAEEAPEEKDIERIEVIGAMTHYSATKSATPIMETARSVSIETQQQMLDKGVMVLDDAYTYSAGVIGETFGFATRGDWVKVRGLDVPQYQDSLQSLFGNYNNTRPDVYTLEQVEILKGPASVLYGKGSPGGIVNVVSKRPQEQARHEILAELGNFSHKRLAFDSTGSIDDQGEWLYRGIGVWQDSDTQIDHVNDDKIVFAPSITWRPSEQTDVTFLVNYTDVESDTAAQFLPIYGTLLDASNGQKIDNSFYAGEPEFNKYDAETKSATLLVNHIINDVWQMQVNARFTDAEANYQQAWTSFIGGDRYLYNTDGSLYKDGTVPRSFYRSDASSEQKALDVRFLADFMTGSLEHEVLMGAQYQDVTTDDDGYYAYALGYAFAPGEPQTPLGDAYWINVFDPVYGNVPPDELLDALYTDNPETNAEDIGFYISDQISFGNWLVNLGLRYDDTETQTASETQSDDELSLSAGVMYQFNNGVSPYFSYAESFEPVIGDNGNGQPLKPQEGEQWEVGVKYQPTGFPGFMTLAYFDITQSNLSDPSSLPGDFEQQRGEATIEGVEFESIVTLGDFTVELNASHLDTESADGYQLASVPENQASTWVSYRPGGEWDGFKAGVGVRYVGDSYGGMDMIETPSYTLGDLMLGYEMDHWDFSVNVRNLTDKEYYATCLARGDCFVGDERTVVGRVRYVF